MKTTRIVYWISTSLIFIMEGVIPAFTSQTELAKSGITHLQYPLYFGTALAIFKVLGALTLMLPFIPKRMKEWAYAGFTFNFLFASISYLSVEGFSFNVVVPMIFLSILAISYNCYHRLCLYKEKDPQTISNAFSRRTILNIP